MQSALIGFIILLLSTALQSAWPTWLRIGEQPPNLLLAAVMCIGLVRGAFDGSLAGLVAALLLGGSSHTPVGGLFAGYMVVGAIAGLLRGSIFAERVLVAMLISCVGVLVFETLRMFFMPPYELAVTLRAMFWSALFTALSAPVMFWAARLIRSREAITI